MSVLPLGNAGSVVIPAIPTFVGASASNTYATTRPTGTASGDRLILAYSCPSSFTTPLALTGWTLLSGYDQAASPKFAIYTRTADLGANDIPNLGAVATLQGWVMVAVRGASTIAAALTKAVQSTATATGVPITTTTFGVFVLWIVFCGNNATVAAPSGGPTDRLRGNAASYGIGVASTDQSYPGTPTVPTWVIGSAQNILEYAIGLSL